MSDIQIRNYSDTDFQMLAKWAPVTSAMLSEDDTFILEFENKPVAYATTTTITVNPKMKSIGEALTPQLVEHVKRQVKNEPSIIQMFMDAQSLDKSAIREMIANAERAAMDATKQPEKNVQNIEIPIQHFFSKDVYAREMTQPKGTVVFGKIHKHQNLCIISQGDVSIMSIDGVLRVKAPYTFVSQPGAKRLIYAHQDTVWTVIHGTAETDVDKIEEQFIAKTYDEVAELVAKEAEVLKLCHG